MSLSRWEPLLWLGPAAALILGVVAYPVIMLVQASTERFSITGLRKGSAGWDNYAAVAAHDSVVPVLGNTLLWVSAIVSITMVIGLALAQLLTLDFPGRRMVRWAVIVPWAASLVITAQIFVLIYDVDRGLANALLGAWGVGPVDFLGDDAWTMPSMILVGVFVSLPFTTFVLVAGLNAVPGDVLDAARIDGAGPWQAYRSITLPLLRPAIVVASVMNVIYVFNSFPIVYTLNDRNPGFLHDTTITFMYKLAFKSQEKDVGMAAAAGVCNVVLVLAVVVAYLTLVGRRDEAM